MRIEFIEIADDSVNGGDRVVTERHVYSDGSSSLYSYLCATDLDAADIAARRKANINIELERREQQALEAENLLLPLTKTMVMSRITVEEWSALQTSTIPEVAFFRDVFNQLIAPIDRNSDLTQQGFGLLVAAGILAAHRVAVILA